MREFTEPDFAPLDGFPLLGRWTRRTHYLLPSNVLATIRPLTPMVAAELAPAAAAACDGRSASELELAISAEWDDPAPVRRRLEAVGIPESEPVVLSWSDSLAVVTRWGTFVRYWDAFCYPLSDDVTVWAPGGDWTLCYHHFQFIEFGRTRPAA